MGRVTGRSGGMAGLTGPYEKTFCRLDEVYVQAKKYAESNTVGESDLRNFAGAIDAAGTEQRRVCYHRRFHQGRAQLRWT